MLFSKAERTYLGRRLHAESSYSFLERSALPESGKVRELLERWLGSVPEPEQSRLCAEMRSREGRRFTSAFTELHTHELLRSLGYEVEYHPDIGHKSGRRPEFLAKESDDRVIVEVTTAVDMAEDEARADPDRRAVYDAINDLPIRGFWVDLDEEGLPKQTPSVNRITSDLQNWIGKLDYDELSREYKAGDMDCLPTMTQTYRGWALTFTAIPKPTEIKDETDGSVILMQSFGVRVMTTKDALRKAVKRKATRYGKLDSPYVIVVNVEASHVKLDEVFQALISTIRFTWTPSILKSGGQPRNTLARDGIWLGPKGPCNTRVSAVLIACRLHPWSVAACDVQLVHNPWPARPVEGRLAQLTQWVPEEGQWVVKEGAHPRELFDLSENWLDE